MKPERFTIRIPQADIDDLKRRLEKTRWPGDLANDNWHYGSNESYLRELVRWWHDKYDWRAHEKEMNQYEHYRLELDGQPLHYLRTGRAGGPALLLLGGWPWTFWDFAQVMPNLSDYELVVPDLPGYAFSSPLKVAKMGSVQTAVMLHELMTEVLGYRRYGIYGSDWGALIGESMAHSYPEEVVGLHTSMPFPLDSAPIPQELWTAEEAPYAQIAAQFWQTGSAYFQMHVTRPQTIAYLSDSPVATAAWLVEKFRAWSDHCGNLEEAYPKERMLTTVSIYWLTNTFGSSARFYAESIQNPWKPVRDGLPVISVPSGVAAFPKDVAQVPRKWVEQYFNLKRYTRMSRGGHFPAIEDPKGLSAEIAAFFGSL